MMHEFPLVQRFIEQGIEQGRQEGRQEGERKGVVESILTLLGTRFQSDAVQVLKPNLESIGDLPRLRELLITASDAQSLEAFMQSLRQ
jgi:predicted transposase YdaD